MMILLSPAKSLDFETPVSYENCTTPQFVKQATELMRELKKQSPPDLKSLMKLSDQLSEQNFDRNQQWKSRHDENNSRPAIYAFQGDVYQGLDAVQLTAAQVKRCQKRVRILSGLYGVLRPLDLIQPYRLEMSTRLQNSAGKNLYEFWGDRIAKTLSQELTALKSDLVVNLASNEYSKAAKLKSLSPRVVSPAFREWKNGEYKMISFFAKRARGLMTRYLLTHNIAQDDGLLSFDLDGYSYNESLSAEGQPVFTRKASS